jgi:hypothetical protein
LVAVICATPLLLEALTAAMGPTAEVRSFPAGGGDTDGLLRWLAPDAVVVDRAEEAEAAAAFARLSGAPLLHISLTECRLRVLSDSGWTEPAGDAGTAGHLRNVLVGMMFRRGGSK